MTFEEPPDIPGNPSGYIRSLIQSDVGPTEGLRNFRDAGGSIQDSRWFDLYHQVDATLADNPTALGLDPLSLPGPGDYTTWALGRGGQYMTQVEVQVRDRDTGFFLTKQYTYVTDQPHTAAEAEDDAFDLFGDPDTENAYGETVMGAIAVTFAQTVPYAA